MNEARMRPLRRQMLRILQKKVKRDKRRRQLFRQRNCHGIMQPTKSSDWSIVIGDKVEVVKGRDEGKQGKIIKVYRAGESVIVEGCNLRLKKSSGDAGEYRTFWKESPILLKHVALLDEDSNVPTPVEYKFQQLAVDSERYQRVRQSAVGGDIIAKPDEAKPKRAKRPCHKTKDTPPSLAAIRTWVGPWQLFSEEQQEFVLEDVSRRYSKEIPNARGRIADLLYNNVEEVHEYLRMLPEIPHAFFKPGTCTPYSYQTKPVKKWSKRKIKRMLALTDGPKSVRLSEDLIAQLRGRRTFPKHLTEAIDPKSYWPRVDPTIDPKFRDLLIAKKEQESSASLGGSRSEKKDGSGSGEELEEGVVVEDELELRPKAEYISEDADYEGNWQAAAESGYSLGLPMADVSQNWKRKEPTMHFSDDIHEDLDE